MLRKLNTLMLLGALVVCMLVVLAGCFDPDQFNQHSPAHIGTDPFTGGFDPATGRELVNGVLTVVAPPAPPVIRNPSGAAKFSDGANGRPVFLGCPGDIAADGSTVPNYNCADFTCQPQAQAFFVQLNALQPGRPDCHGLDGPIGAAGNGIACSGLRASCP